MKRENEREKERGIWYEDELNEEKKKKKNDNDDDDDGE